jgi:hypothetical protein
VPYALDAVPVQRPPGAAEFTAFWSSLSLPLLSYWAPVCGVPSPNVERAFDHVDKNASSTLIRHLSAQSFS